MGHLEYAPPECTTLADLGHRIEPATVSFSRRSRRELDGTVSLIKNNIDHETDATFGSHENYLVSRQFPFSRRI